MTNSEIGELFRNVASAYYIKDEKKFRFQIIAYQNAAKTIENMIPQISDLIKDEQPYNLPGIGPTIKDHLEELIKTGKVKHFEWVFKGIPEAVFVLLKVPSFGPKTAYKLVEAFHLNSPDTVINDLEKIAKKDKISKLPGFGKKSQTEILQSILEYKKGKDKVKRMTLPFAYDNAMKVIEYMKKLDAVVQIEPLGSLRRMVPTIGDVDLAVSTSNPKAVVAHFLSYPYIERVLDKGNVSSSIIVSGECQVDLKIQPPDAFGSLLQHFTGSKAHNIHLREFALKKGLSLSEYGIKKLKDEKITKYDSEEKFYNALGLTWIPPEMREDTGEIELAAANKLPQIIELSNIKGDLHIHSDFPIEPSHDLGIDSMETMLSFAEKLNYEYLGFSEHNPSKSKHSKGQIIKILENKKKRLELLNSSNKHIRVFNLLEVDIAPDGSLAIDEQSLDLLDFAIVSVHSSFGLDKKDMTDRILKGLAHKKAKILAHPTGRLINERTGYELDWDKIFEFCRKYNKALEINSWPNRLDIQDNLIRQAIDHNVKLTINTDSHAVNQMKNMRFGIGQARRGWAKKSDIINSFSYNELKEWVKS
jgi:DNA polymerase (family 10)